MMTDNELDNLFKNTLGNYEAPVPADMWQRIQPGDSKKRPVLFWWKWYVAAAVFVIAGSAVWWYATDTTTAKSKSTMTFSDTAKKQSNKQAIQNAGASGATAIALQKKNSLNDTDDTNDSQLTVQNYQPTASPFTNSKKEKNTYNTPLAVASGKMKNFSLNSKEVNSLPVTSGNNHTDTNFNAAPTLRISDTPSPEVINQSSTANNNITAQTAASDSSDMANTPALKKEKKKTNKHWTIELLATSAFAGKQTYAVVKETAIGLAAPIPQPQPKASLWNYNAGLRLGIPITKKLVLKTGLQFAQTRQTGAYQQQNIVDLVSINGFADTSFYRRISYQGEKQISTYNALGVPVLVTYQTGKKIQIGATAGLLINAYSWYTGKVPDAKYSATLEAKKTYRRNTGAALYAGISVAKKIGTIEIFAEPHLQYSLSSFTKSTIPFKQKINTYGLSVGIRTALHK